MRNQGEVDLGCRPPLPAGSPLAPRDRLSTHTQRKCDVERTFYPQRLKFMLRVFLCTWGRLYLLFDRFWFGTVPRIREET